MSGITGVLDPITERIEDFSRFEISPEDLSIAIGGVAIGTIVSALEERFIHGWLRPIVLGIGGIATFYAAGSSRSSRVKREGAVIGATLLVNAIKDLVENRTEVLSTFKNTVEAVKRGGITAILPNIAGPSPTSFPSPTPSPTPTQTPSETPQSKVLFPAQAGV